MKSCSSPSFIGSLGGGKGNFVGNFSVSTGAFCGACLDEKGTLERQHICLLNGEANSFATGTNDLNIRQ